MGEDNENKKKYSKIWWGIRSMYGMLAKEQRKKFEMETEFDGIKEKLQKQYFKECHAKRKLH